MVISCLFTSTFSAFRMVSCSRILNSSSSSSSLSMPYAQAPQLQLQPSDNLTEASVAVFHDLSAFVDTFKSFKHN
jgi:hypothetical protein